MQSANTIHALPLLSDKPAWLPVDYAAKTIVEGQFLSPCSSSTRSSASLMPSLLSLAVISLPSSASPTVTPVWHILQPRVVSWNGVLESFKKAGLEFEAVDQRTWVQRLRESDDDAAKNPTKKLLEFFEGEFISPSLPAAFPLCAKTDATSSRVSPLQGSSTSTTRPSPEGILSRPLEPKLLLFRFRMLLSATILCEFVDEFSPLARIELTFDSFPPLSFSQRREVVQPLEGELISASQRSLSADISLSLNSQLASSFSFISLLLSLLSFRSEFLFSLC